MTDGLTTAVEKLGIPRLFRYFASGLTIALVTWIVNPRGVCLALDELKGAMAGELETPALLMALLAIGLVGSLIVRNVIGRLLLHRVQDFAACWIFTNCLEPTTVSYLMEDKKSLRGFLAARTTYIHWRRGLNQATSVRLDLAHAEIDLIYLVGTTWLLAGASLLLVESASIVLITTHVAFGFIILAAAVVADWRQHQYEFVLFQEGHGLGVAERSKLRRL